MLNTVLTSDQGKNISDDKFLIETLQDEHTLLNEQIETII
jgi:hypothetical protein